MHLVPGKCPGISQRRITVLGRQILLYLRQFQRKRRCRQSVRHTVLKKNRYRFAPVTLTRKDSVTLPEVNLAMPYTTVFNLINDLYFGQIVSQAIQKFGVDAYAVFTVVAFNLNILIILNHIYNFEAKLHSKTVIALVMSRYSHHCAGTVAHQHIV